MPGAIERLLARSIAIRPGELAALFWSCAYFFLILTAYYILRPIRDEMGVAGGVQNLAWLFTGTLAGMLLLHPLYTALVSRLPRKRFIPLTYRFFIANLLVFFALLSWADAARNVWVGRAFFIWLSIFNLFVVSVFWSFMTDLYQPQQSKRLFGAIAVGGTLGAMLGSTITTGLAGWLGPLKLMLVSALVLELAARAARLLDHHEPALRREAESEARENGTRDAGSCPEEPVVVGGGVSDGIRSVVTSPYLLGIAGLVLLFTIASTFLYFQRIDIVSRTFEGDPGGRIRLFAGMDLATNVLTLGTQIFLTGRLLRWLGLGFGLAFLPVLSLIGFGLLGAMPVLAVVVVFEVLRRAGNFALARPAREILYTVLSRSDKYKAKNFNDTFVYRLGDQIGSWSYTAMAWFGLGLSGLALAMLPVSLLWLVLALWLARRNRRILASD
ncbi:MAG: MFS transporter [Rhodocyclaceae bacterium]|nr:MFS transporter [Rhodocyclaceae bacterium]